MIRRLAVLAVTVAVAVVGVSEVGALAPGFVEGTVVGVNFDHPKQWGPVLFVNTATGDGLTQFPSRQWVTVDASRFLPADVKAVNLTMMLLITHGSQPGIADLALQVRRPGSGVMFGNYHTQTLEAATTGGQRTSDSVWVAVVDGKFEAYWQTPLGEPAWPVGSAYGVNMHVQAYLR